VLLGGGASHHPTTHTSNRLRSAVGAEASGKEDLKSYVVIKLRTRRSATRDDRGAVDGMG